MLSTILLAVTSSNRLKRFTFLGILLQRLINSILKIEFITLLGLLDHKDPGQLAPVTPVSVPLNKIVYVQRQWAYHDNTIPHVNLRHIRSCRINSGTLEVIYTKTSHAGQPKGNLYKIGTFWYQFSFLSHEIMDSWSHLSQNSRQNRATPISFYFTTCRIIPLPTLSPQQTPLAVESIMVNFY